ncbi:hypothetical protein N1851_000481 [Merluccius polli]|uniref:Uncharacterized protein n=1 Tax=Merluccius polli TaxID=89951 RepID=A0AA47PD31_MERPO|nr:hypothetical protein N1851_000481 [Merluccius polli]
MPAVIASESITPRSFIIKTQQGAELRRNRRHLQPEPVPESSPPATSGNTGTDTHSDTLETVPTGQSVATPASPTPGQTATRSGRVCKPVNRLDL